MKYTVMPNPSAAPSPGVRKLADNAEFTIWARDADGVCTYINSSAAVYLDRLADFSLEDCLSCIHPDDLARLLPEHQKARETASEYQVSFRIVRSDGSIRWMQSNGAPRCAQDGTFLGYAGAIIDVTERYALLESKEKSEASFRMLAENSSDLISHHGPSGTYIYASPSSARILGFTPEELIGMNVYDRVHPEDLSIVQSEVRNQVRSGSAGSLIEFRAQHKDGHYVYLGTKATVLTDSETHEKIGTIAVSRDITVERRIQEELRKREERFRSLTQLSADWLWETDENDRFTFISEGLFQSLGVQPEQFLGQQRFDLTVEVKQPGLREYARKVQRRETFKDIRYQLKPQSKSGMRWISVSGEPVFEQDVFKGYRGISQDITESVLLAESFSQLAAENKAMIDNSTDIMIVFDQTGTIVRANTAATDILGYELDELVGKRYIDYVVPADVEQTRQAVKRIYADGEGFSDLENRWFRKDESIVHLAWSWRYRASVKLAYATARDVTERHLDRLALQQTNEKLTTTLERLGQGFFALDRDWRVLYANKASAAFVNRSQKDLFGKVVADAVPEFVGTAAALLLQKAVETGEPVLDRVFYGPANAWVDLRAYPHAEGLSVFYSDVTEQHETALAYQKSQQRVHEIIEMTPAGYILADASNIIQDVNPALCSMTGYARGDLIGRELGIVFSQIPFGASTPTQGSTGIHSVDCTVNHKDGPSRHVLANANTKFDEQGVAESISIFLTDITERKAAELRLEQMAKSDTLTGLPNRACLNDRLEYMLENARGTEIAVIFIDLDRFKEVNDTLGHEAGDILLKDVSHRLQAVVRENDIVARLGGDEFVVAAYCTDGLNSATRIAEKLMDTVSGAFDVQGHEVFVGASIGISIYPHDARSKEILYQNADTAMYAAKNGGRNGFRFFKEEMSVEAKRQVYLENSLRKALERGEFELYYQPRISLATHQIAGMEALIRWNHPELGIISPAEFVPLAEERGYIEAIGQWVLHTACAHTQQLASRFEQSLRVSVNLSARQLRNTRIVDQVAAALAESGLPAALLELELTESALIEDVESTAALFKALKGLGVAIAIDDFGTGYSSLAYLRKFAVDTVKLDRSFLEGTGCAQDTASFIKAFVDLAHALKLQVVAEGVETAENLALLGGTTCDEVQGFFFAKPMPLGDFEAFVQKGL